MQLRQKEFKSLQASIKKEYEEPCALCGRVGTLRTAATHSSYPAYNGKKLWVSTYYAVDHMYLGFISKKFKNNIAGVCSKCCKKILLRLYFHDLIAKTTWYLWRRWWS
jgi:hypothetical protein